jgi:hypothetical protein
MPRKNFLASSIRRWGFVLILLLGAASLAWAEPILTVEKYAHDFGYITQGAMVTHTFTVTNMGDSPVSFTDIDCSLMLLTASVDKLTLYPNETATVKMEYDSRYGMGRVEPMATISTSAPSVQKLDFVLTGYVFNRNAATRNSTPAPTMTRQMMEPPARAVYTLWSAISVFLGIN